jgi:hypothetical protein
MVAELSSERDSLSGRASGEPHWEQNLALSAFWLPHCEQ